MSLPTPQESASMLFDAIKEHYFKSHGTVSDLLIKIAQHIEADRQAHCRHVLSTLPVPGAAGRDALKGKQT